MDVGKVTLGGLIDRLEAGGIVARQADPQDRRAKRVVITPRGMKLALVEAAIREVDGVNDVHDLHVWSIGSETSALSCHISIADIPPSASERILRDVKDRLHQTFRIDHTTIQFEHAICEVAHGCVIPVVENEAEHQQHHHSH